MTVSRLASIVQSGYSYSSIPAEIIASAKLQILSMTAAVLHGKKSPYFSKLKLTDASSLEGRVFLWASLSMMFDYDDFMFAGHTGHSSVLVPFAASLDFLMDGKRFLEHQVMANEIGGRLGASIFLGPHNGQLWSVIHPLMAAAILARETSKKDSEVQNTLNRALSHPVYPLFDTFFSSSSKIFTAAAPLALGVRLSLSGDISAPDFLSKKSSFYERFSYVPLLSVFDDLGETYYSHTLSFKKYPGCAYIAGPVEACERLREKMLQKNMSVASIDRVIVAANLLSKKMDDLSRPHLKGPESSLTTLNFSLPVNCALMLLDGKLTPESFLPESLARPEVWKLAEKVQVRHSPAETLRMMKYSSMVENASSLMLKNFFRLGPYRKRYGLGSDFLKLPGDLLSDLISRQKKKKKISNTSLQKKYHLLNGSLVEVRSASGEKLTEYVDLPIGFAGSDLEETKKFLDEKLRAACSDKDYRFFRDCVNRWESLSAREVRDYASRVESIVLRPK